MKTENNQPKHTPRPWIISDNTATEQISIHTGNEFLPVCFLNYMKDRGSNNEMEQKANAQLIASAPEMLEALKQALWVMEKCEKQGMDFGVEKIAIENAIKKATGQ